MGNSDSRGLLVEAFTTLKESDVSPSDSAFWQGLWATRTSAEEIFELLGPAEVRDLRTKRPRSLVSLFVVAVKNLRQFVQAPSPNKTEEALNCVRVLQRLLPFLLEDPQDALVQRLCWSGAEDPEFIVTGTVASKSADDAQQDAEPAAGEPLGKELLQAALQLLALPGFSVDKGALEVPAVTADSENGSGALPCRYPGAIWAPGLCASENMVWRNRHGCYHQNRIEVLRLLLTALCEPLYKSAGGDGVVSKWLVAVAEPDMPFADVLFYSLMNTVLSHNASGGMLPYSGHLGGQSGLALVEKSAQVLMALLDQPSPVDNDEAEVKRPPNVFCELVGSLRSAKDLSFIFTGLSRLLNNLVDSVNTVLPASVPRISFYQEIMVILWKILEESNAFLDHVLKKCDVTQLVSPLCFMMHSVRREPHLVGIVHICTFILLKMSGDRGLAIACSKVPYSRRLPTDLPLFTGSHCDLLLITLYQVMMAGGERIATQYNCFLTIICNISPYCKSLSLEASMKLVSLFEVFFARNFLYASEANNAYIALLLETYCNIAQYQFEGNPRVIYALVRQKKMFEDLHNLTVQGAKHEAQEVANRKARAKAESQGPSAGTPPANWEAPVPFMPDKEWLDALKPTQSLTTLQCLMSGVSAEIDEHCNENKDAFDEGTILDCIASNTMVGLLPVPHPIIIRQYQTNPMTSLWFTAQLWVIIFMQNQVMPLFDGSKIRLFSVSVADNQGRAARRTFETAESGGGETPAAAQEGETTPLAAPEAAATEPDPAAGGDEAAPPKTDGVAL